MYKIYHLILVGTFLFFQGCNTSSIVNKTTTTNKVIKRYSETKYVNKHVEHRDIKQITWAGFQNIDSYIYIKSLQAYVKKEFPQKYNNKNNIIEGKIIGEHRSPYSVSYSSADFYCNLYGNYVTKYPEYYKRYPSTTGIIQCIKYEIINIKTDNLEFYSFLSDKKKLSLLTNYLITQKYSLKKDKFEKTSDFKKRVQYVKDNIESITSEYMSISYDTVYGHPIIEETNYDADNELFYGVLKSTKGNLSEKIAVNIPLDIARSFYSGHKKVKVIYEYKDGKVYLKNIIISYNNQNYMAVLNKMNYKPSELKVALYQDIKYGEKLISELNNDIPKLLKRAQAHKIDKHKWLFIIGIENYEYTNSVKYSTNSAKSFKDVMKKRLGIPENNVRTLINRGATSSKIDFRLREMLRKVKKGDTIYFFYSGHGIPVPSQNNTPYMLAQDMNPAYLNDERFKLETIYKQLSDSKASKIIAFIDSCFSGGTDNQILIKGVAATRLKPKNVTFNKSKMLVISAGSGVQYSNKYDERSNRLFSYYVMKGLIQNNTDTQRLYDYVKSNVQEKSYEMGASYEQIPVYSGNVKLGL